MNTVTKLLVLARHAATGYFGVLSTGEKLAAALILNRPDWLADMNYTLADAIWRVGPEWLRDIPAAAEQFDAESPTSEARRGD